MGGQCRTGRWRLAALVVGCLAALAMVIVGCASVTQGTAEVDSADAPLYRASVSSSLEISAASSSARESERQAASTTRAIHNACDGLSSSSVDAVAAVNAYVDAVNREAPDAEAKAGPAIDGLNISADLVTSSLSDVLGPELRAALTGWADAARAVAGAIADNAGPDDFNVSVTRLNDSRDVALNLCDASY